MLGRSHVRTPPASPSPEGPSPTTSTALSEPTRPVNALWVTGISIANLGMWMAFFGPLQVLLPEQVALIDPEGKETSLAWITGLGAFFAMVGTPLVGALSDRTTGRFGRRRPWILAGAVLGCLGLILLGRQSSILGVLVGWSFVQASLSCLMAPLLASVPDQVPVRQRGVISGWIGIPQAAGVVIAVLLVTVVTTGIAPGYTLLGVLVLLCALPFALAAPDPPLPAQARPPWSDHLRNLWISPRKYPDFGWAWLTRFLVQTGNSMFTLYLLYFLRDRVGYEELFPGSSATEGLLVLILIHTAASVITTVVAGLVSDRIGRRRGMVFLSGVVMTVPALALALSPTWTTGLICAVLFGVGFGIFLSVDNALVTQVLPTASGRAKDLGIVNIASAGPQVIAPALAGPIVVHLGGYSTLYTVCGMLTLLGGILVWRIKGVP